MRTKLSVLILTVLSLACQSPKNKNQQEQSHADHDHSQHVEGGNDKSKSPRTTAMANIGSNHVHIDYSSPSVRGRQIFGGLVGYGEVWVTGAHTATSLSFSEDILIEGNLVPKGKYALFTIPGEHEWTVILNKNWDQHLADDYDDKEDILRLNLIPVVLDEEAETLVFEIQELKTGEGLIGFKWADIGFSFTIQNP